MKENEKRKATVDYNKITWKVMEYTIKIIVTIVLIALFYTGITRGYAFGYKIFNPEPLTAYPGTDVSIQVERDQGFWELGKELKRMQVIDDPYVFWAQAMIYQYEAQPGIYTVNSGMTSREIIIVLSTAYAEDYK